MDNHIRISYLRILFCLYLMSYPFLLFAEEVKFDYQFSSDLRGYYYDGEKDHHSSNVEKYADNYIQVMLNMSTELTYDNLTIPFKSRINDKYSTVQHDNHSEYIIDELLLDYAVTKTFIVNIGRKQINNGVAMGYNPTDFINLDKFQDRHLSDQQRRSEIKGSNLIGFIKYFETSSIQIFYLPNDQDVFLQYTNNLTNLNTDLGLSYYYGDYSSFGLNISTTLNDKLTGYIENAISTKRNRVTISGNDLEQENHKKGIYNDLVLGLQYTTDKGINLNLEYWYNQHGYSKSEYNNIVSYIYSPYSNYYERTHYLSIRNLFRNKLFFRASDIPITDEIMFEPTLIYSINDKSIFIRTSFVYQITHNAILRLSGDMSHGNDDSEYGRSPVNIGAFISLQFLY